LNVPRPGWLGELLTWSPVVTVRSAPAPAGVGANASGTSYWHGGMTWVGEKGPEIVSLPKGSQIYSNQESKAMAGGVNVTVHATVSNGLDVEELALKIARIVERRGRGL